MPTPTTGVLCEIRHADDGKKKALLYPKPGLGPDGGREPFEVAIVDLKKQLEQYVKIDHENATETNRYTKLELCEPGVDLIDSVGLDDPRLRRCAASRT